MAQKLSNLPIGAKIKFGKHQIASETALPIIWVVGAKNHTGYPTNSVTLITEKVIDVRPYDAAETGAQDGNCNYALSNINQWLNSSAAAGSWYTAAHTTDAAPSYRSRPGFLYNFTEYDRSLILPTTLTIPNASSISPKVFLLSLQESRGSSPVNDGSIRLAYFDGNALTATMTESTFNAYSGVSGFGNIAKSVVYWTRTFSGTYAYAITATADSIGYAPSSTFIGVRPALNLSATTKISDTTDSDGCYTIVVNKVPAISGTNTNLGTKSAGFSHSYSITEGDSEAVTVTEEIDNTSIRSYVATLGSTNTFAVTGNTWLKLSNGTHTLKITATDGWDTATRTITFTKSVNKLVVQRTTPMEASKRPSQIIVSLVKTIPYNAKLTVEVCNNGFDASPMWETLDTSSIYSGLAHEFENEVCTAGKWGVNIKVTVDRNGADGACFITEIGGNFE